MDVLCECFCASVCTGSVVKGWQYVQTRDQRATLNVLDDLLCFISSVLRLFVADFLVISVWFERVSENSTFRNCGCLCLLKKNKERKCEMPFSCSPVKLKNIF